MLDQRRLEELRQFALQKQKKSSALIQFQNNFADPGMLVLPPMVPADLVASQALIDPHWFHPHMTDLLGVPLDQVLSYLSVKVKEEDESKMSFVCPRCQGSGQKHESSANHEKKKCKHCITCKGNCIHVACSGSGAVVGKRACSLCDTRGFVHLNTDRPHDVGELLRCFFCKDCPNCKGVGVEPIKKRKKRDTLQLLA